MQGINSEDVFCNANERDIRISIRVPRCDQEATDSKWPDELVFIIPRNTNTWRAELVVSGDTLRFSEQPTLMQQNTKRFFKYDEAEVLLTGYFHALAQLSDTFYVGPFRNAINVGTKGDYFDIQVGQSFITRWRSLKTGPGKKNNEAIYQLTDDIRQVFGFDTLEINPTADDQNIQLIIDGKSYLLSEQGAGLAQFILVLANAAVRRPLFILIDEPELSLHPSLQLDFLTTLGSYTLAGGGVLFATHSYGLARAAADMVYSVHRNKQGERQLRPLEATARLPEFLGELGYSGYTELGFSKVLLVEGPSEVKTVQQFLRKLHKDHEVVILPLGGSSLIKVDCTIELQELHRICKNVRALVDSEQETEGASPQPDRVAFQKTCKSLQIECHILDRRATENYFTEAAVQRVMGPKYHALGPYLHFLKRPVFTLPSAAGW